MATLDLQVVTPYKTVLNENVEMVICPGVVGEFGVLPHHASMLAALKIGKLTYRINGQDKFLFISGGFADIHNNVCRILAESAEKSDEIDRKRAEAAKKRAEDRLAQRNEALDSIRAEVALKRAIKRLEISNL